jgi:hypothetical protein
MGKCQKTTNFEGLSDFDPILIFFKALNVIKLTFNNSDIFFYQHLELSTKTLKYFMFCKFLSINFEYIKPYTSFIYHLSSIIIHLFIYQYIISSIYYILYIQSSHIHLLYLE